MIVDRITALEKEMLQKQKDAEELRSQAQRFPKPDLKLLEQNAFFKRVEKMAAQNPKQELTEWFPADVKPVHVGRYQVSNPWIDDWFGEFEESEQEWFWDGSKWVDRHGRPSYRQDRKWRGLRSKP